MHQAGFRGMGFIVYLVAQFILVTTIFKWFHLSIIIQTAACIASDIKYEA